MARFAPVAPLVLTEDMVSKGIIGPYHLWLAHEVLAEPIRWAKIADEIREQFDDEVYIILDNGVIELGQPLPTDDLMRACNHVKPTILVLPDRIMQKEWTMVNHLSAAAEWLDYCQEHDIGYMAVPQGRTLFEVMACATMQLTVLPNISALGLGRYITDNFGTRVNIARCLTEQHSHLLDVHLLGFSGDMWDDHKATAVPGIMGIDSNVPLRMGLNNIEFNFAAKDPGPRRDDHNWSTATTLNKQAEENLEFVRRFLDNS